MFNAAVSSILNGNTATNVAVFSMFSIDALLLAIIILGILIIIPKQKS